MKKYFLVLPFILLQLFVFGQKEWSNWYSNGKELLTFRNGFPERIDSFVKPIPSFPPVENLFDFYYWGLGGISYSDPVTGDVKFIISQRLGFGKDYNDFPNDTFIRSCPDQKSYHIIPFHNDPNKFYVIQFQSAVADLLAQESGLQVRCPNAVGLAYSIVDLSKNGGLGDFTTVNNVITGGLTEQITLVRHANGKDVWIIVHPYGTAQYQAILATDAGFQAPISSTIGAMINGGWGTSYGDITASHDGKLLAGCRSTANETGNESDVELFDFDNATGLLSNYRTLPSEGHVLKLQFSPDNSKLYAVGFDENYNSSPLVQWDFNQPDVAASKTTIENIKNGNVWDMQLAPDGKIYISSYQEYVGNDFHNYLMAIQCPNLPQYACNFYKKSIEIYAPAFPDLVNDFINVPRETPTPKFSIGNDTAICFGSLTLTAPSGWQSYRWNTGETSRSVTVTTAGVYFVLTGNPGFSCPTGFGYINVMDKAIRLDLGKDTGLCAKTPYRLQVPDNYTNILWSNGSHAKDSILYGGGYITISANDVNGCYTNDTINVYEKYYPKANFGNDTVLCNNETLPLQLLPYKVFTPGAVYSWQNNSIEDSFTVRQPGTYWGTVSYDGCTVSDTITISYVNGENVSIGNDTAICMGDSLLISSSIAFAKYLWNTGDTTKSIYVSYPGEYRLKVTTGNCSLQDTILISVNTKPSFSLGNDTAICRDDLLVLSPNTGGGNYLWQDGSILDHYAVNSEGLYWVKFSQNGCTASDSITILYKNLPPLDLGKDTGFCTGTLFRLSAYDPAIQSYLWQDQTTLPGYLAAEAGNYFVTVTGTNGCKKIDTISLTTRPIPIFTLGNDTALCDGKRMAFDFTIADAAYLWNNGSTSGQFSISLPGTYWLSVNQQGCIKRDSITVTYKPSPVVRLGNDTTLCEGDTKVLTAINNNAVYKWQDGSNNSIFTVRQPGMYVVSADINGCKTADSVNIFYTAKPLFTLGRDTFICKGQGILLNPTVNTAVEYHWQDGSNFSSYTVTDTGRYILTVFNECGTATSSVMINQGVCQLYLPNAFTPNSDNLNDIFRVKYPFVVKEFNLAVYNRFGQKIFETSSMAKGWDGSFNGAMQPGGAYVWVVSLTDIDGRNKTINGTVLLIR